MTIDLQALKDELTTNPVSMPYLALIADNDVANADVINNEDGSNPRTVNNETVDTAALRANTIFDAFDGLSPSEQAFWEWLTQNGELPVTSDTLADWAGIGGTSKWALGDRATMEPRMAALMQFQGSRAQEIKDTLGVSVVSPANVRDARLLP